MKKEEIEDKRYEGYPVTMRQLLESGVHFGHQTKRWNPKMAKFIYTARNDIHVIDLQQTIECVKQAYDTVKSKVKKNGRVLFVGTKKQAKEAVASEAVRCGMPYINQRWWGGTLTNHYTILKSVRLLKQLEEENASGFLDQLPKKEAAVKRRKIAKLSYFVGGIKELNILPTLLVVVDTNKEQLAIAEAKKLGIPVIGIVDTNADPNDVDIPIPANDDAIRSVKLILSVLANGVLESKEAIASEADKPKSETKAEEAVVSSEMQVN